MSASEKELLDLCDSGNQPLHIAGPGGKPPASSVDGWKVVATKNLQPGDSQNDGGFAAVIYQKNGQSVVVFKGTDFKTYGDTSADVDLAVGAHNPQYDAEARFLTDNRKNIVGDVTFAGHSLGGHLAMNATITSGIAATCVTFNAPGFSDEYIKAHPNFHDYSGKITEFQNKGDIVSSIGLHPSEPVVVESKANSSFLKHDLSDLLFNGGSLVRTGSQDKELRCAVIHAVSRVLDKTAQGGALYTFVIGVLNVIYSPSAVRTLVVVGLLALVVAIGLPAVIVGALVIVLACIAYDIGYMIGMKLAEFVEWLAGKAEEIAKGIAQGLVAIGTAMENAINAVLDSIRNVCNQIGKGLADFWNTLFGGGGGTVGRFGRIVVDTGHLSSLAWRVTCLEGKVAAVREHIGAIALFEPLKAVLVWNAEWSMAPDWALLSCATYLEQAALQFEWCEAGVLGKARQI